MQNKIIRNILAEIFLSNSTQRLTNYSRTNINVERFYIGQNWQKERKKEGIPRLSATLRYRVLYEDSFESSIFSLQLLLAVALDRRPV
jgi:hypothetical protein